MSGKRYGVVALLLTWVSCVFAVAPVTVELVEVRKIWDQGPHNAFTDLVWHNQTLYVSYYSSHEAKTSIYLARLKVTPRPASSNKSKD